MAKMPGRQQLLAMFASMLQFPLASFMRISSAPLSGFARGLSELAKKKESSPA
jgi:ribosomal protein L10